MLGLRILVIEEDVLPLGVFEEQDEDEQQVRANEAAYHKAQDLVPLHDGEWAEGDSEVGSRE
jgi:hypothetical protein